MKKLTAVFAVLVLLVSLLTFGVHAEGFVFREVSRAQGDTSIQVVWNHEEAADGDEIEDILIGGVSREFTLDEEKTIIVDTSALDAGVYTVVYEYVSGAEQKTVQAKDLTISGTAEVTLSAVINDDGTVTVTAKNASGVAVPGYSLLLTIGNMSGITGQTNANGKYTSFITLDYGQSVTYEGVATEAGLITYAAAAQQSAVRQRPTTTTKATTTTVPTTTGTETTTDTTATTTDTTVGTTVSTTAGSETTGTSADMQTIVTVIGTGTTSVKNDKVLLNVSTDTGILNLFGCEAEDFADKARLHISQEDYVSLVGRNSSNMLMLNMLTSANQVSETQIRAALEGAEAFADYGENERTWATFDLSFLILDKGGNVIPVSAMPIDSTYVVELPVPESMKNCDELAITLKDGDGLMTPVKVAVSGGTFKLEINALESYTLIGFASEGGNAGGVSSWVVWLFVIGILLLAGAGVLLFFFVFRKPAPAAAAAVAEEEAAPPIIVSQPEDDGNDIYSGRTDMPPTDGD